MSKSRKTASRRKLPSMGLGECLLGQAELRNVTEVIRKRALFRYYGMGNAPHRSFVSRLERAAEKRLDAKYALGVSSGTAALEVALGALGVGPGDEVIVPVWSWVSCFTAVVRMGARPVLAEVDDTLNLDPREIARLATPRLRGALVVHYQGVPADMDPVLKEARARKLWVLEDNAESLGASYKGRMAGSIGDMGTFSFQQRKVVTTGEGGMVVTNAPRLYERAARMADLGLYRAEHQARKAMSEPMFVGSNFRMAELPGAVALGQFARLRGMIRHVRSLRDVLMDEIGEIPEISWRRIPDRQGDLGFETYLFMPTAAQARAVQERVGKRGITLTPHTGTYAQTAREYVRNRRTHAEGRGPFEAFGEWPAPGYRPEDFPRTHDLAERLIAIPLGALFSRDDAAYIGRAVRKEILEALRR